LVLVFASVGSVFEGRRISVSIIGMGIKVVCDTTFDMFTQTDISVVWKKAASIEAAGSVFSGESFLEMPSTFCGDGGERRVWLIYIGSAGLASSPTTVPGSVGGGGTAFTSEGKKNTADEEITVETRSFCIKRRKNQD